MDEREKKSIEYAVLSLLSFFDIEEHPLTLQEIQKYLYKHDIPEALLRQVLLTSPYIATKEKFFFLKGRNELVYLRKKRQEHVRSLWERVYRYVPLLRALPFVRMVAVCNTLAFQSADEKSDIDLFIILEKNHLWLSRFLITSLLHVLGVRRHGNKVAGRFCLSFYVTTDEMDLSSVAQEPYDIYLAYWIWTMVPVFGEQYYERFIAANAPFLSQYFGDKLMKNTAWCIQESRHASRLQATQERILKTSLGVKLERTLGQWQKKRAYRKLRNLGPDASNVVTDSMLKSHNHDRRAYYRVQYEDRLESVGLL